MAAALRRNAISPQAHADPHSAVLLADVRTAAARLHPPSSSDGTGAGAAPPLPPA